VDNPVDRVEHAAGRWHRMWGALWMPKKFLSVTGL
jgi:hypothetical protein